MEANEVMFEFSHPVRLNILRELTKETMRLTDISSRFNQSTAEISRHLDRLLNIDTIKKSSDGRYSLTPLGVTLLSQVSYLDELYKRKSFFLSYDLSLLPSHMISLEALSKARIARGTLKNLEVVQEIEDKAQDYLKVLAFELAPQLSEEVLPLANRGIKVFKIYPETDQVPKEFLEHQNIDIRLIDKTGFAFGLSDTMGALILPNVNGTMDYDQILISEEPEFLDWLNSLFEYYNRRSRPYPKK